VDAPILAAIGVLQSTPRYPYVDSIDRPWITDFHDDYPRVELVKAVSKWQSRMAATAIDPRASFRGWLEGWQRREAPVSPNSSTLRFRAL
jgi:hypothetical protein